MGLFGFEVALMIYSIDAKYSASKIFRNTGLEPLTPYVLYATVRVAYRSVESPMREESIGCYVETDTGEILVQLPADNQWGFLLADDDQTWDGGFGCGATSWKPLPEDAPQLTLGN